MRTFVLLKGPVEISPSGGILGPFGVAIVGFPPELGIFGPFGWPLKFFRRAAGEDIWSVWGGRFSFSAWEVGTFGLFRGGRCILSAGEGEDMWAGGRDRLNLCVEEVENVWVVWGDGPVLISPPGTVILGTFGVAVISFRRS